MLVLVRADLDLPRLEGDATQANGEFVRDVRIGAEGPATGPLLGQVEAECRHAGQMFPLAAVPTDRACRLAAMLDAQKRRHDLDAELEGALEPGIVDDAGTSAGKVGSSCDSTVNGVPATASWRSTGSTITQVGQSRLTTATRPSGMF